jgi:hypothetical protein
MTSRGVFALVMLVFGAASMAGAIVLQHENKIVPYQNLYLLSGLFFTCLVVSLIPKQPD